MCFIGSNGNTVAIENEFHAIVGWLINNIDRFLGSRKPYLFLVASIWTRSTPCELSFFKRKCAILLAGQSISRLPDIPSFLGVLGTVFLYIITLFVFSVFVGSKS